MRAMLRNHEHRLVASGDNNNNLVTQLDSTRLNSATTHINSGAKFNLVSNDLDKFNHVLLTLPFAWIGPLQTLVSLYLLWPALGIACLGPLVAVAILIPAQLALSRAFSRARARISKLADRRLQLLAETVGSLRLIKLYAWERARQRKMDEARAQETDQINRVAIIRGASAAFMFVSSKLLLFVTLFCHCFLLGRKLEPSALFMSMALLNNVQQTMTQLIPRLLILAADCLVSLRRIETFLQSPELGDQAKNYVKPRCGDDAIGIECENLSIEAGEQDALLLQKLTFKWERRGERDTRNITLVCGPSGCGKSTLLLALSGELPISSHSRLLISTGTGASCRPTAYCSQEAWLFEGTIRENIVFGRPFEPARYEQVLHACALTRDLELMQDQDLTYIQAGSLSGGQRARVNLARCLYGRSDIYLLDDPLAALDSRVAEHIVEFGLRRFLANKLVCLVNHNRHAELLAHTRELLVLGPTGRMLASGSLESESQTTTTSILEQLKSGLGEDENMRQIYESCSDELERRRRAHSNAIERNAALQAGQMPAANTAADVQQTHSYRAQTAASRRDPARSDGDALESGKRAMVNADGRSSMRRPDCPGDGRELIVVAPAKDGGAEAERIAKRVSFPKIWLHYYTVGSRHSQFALIIVTFLGTQMLFSSVDVYLTVWSSVEQSKSLFGQIASHKNSIQAGAASSANNKSLQNLIALLPQTSLSSSRTNPDKQTTNVASKNNKQTLIKYDERAFSTPTTTAAPWPLTHAHANLAANLHLTGREDAANHRYYHLSPSLSRSDDLETRTNWLLERLALKSRFASTIDNATPVDRFQSVRDPDDARKLDTFSKSTSAHDRAKQTIRLNIFYHINNEPRFRERKAGGYDVALSHEAGSNILRRNNVEILHHFHDGDDGAAAPAADVDVDTDAGDNEKVKAKDVVLIVGLAENSDDPDGDDVDGPLEVSALFQNRNRTASYEPANIILDEDITLESESLLSVNPIYRPLYKLVKRFSPLEHTLTYAFLLILVCLTSAAANIQSHMASNKSGKIFYKRLTDSALFAKISFFDKTPHGRFINRASRDIAVLDEAIPYNANQAYEILLQTMGSFIIIILVQTQLALPSLFLLFIFFLVYKLHVKAAKDIHRYEGILRSPIISHIGSTMAGLPTIRSSECQPRQLELFRNYQDSHSAVFLLYLGSNRLIAVTLDCLNACHLTIIALWVIFQSTANENGASSMSGPSAGLIITSTMLLSGLTQHGLMKLAETESLMTSVERVIEYSKIPQEEDDKDQRKTKENNYYIYSDNNDESNSRSRHGLKNKKTQTTSNENSKATDCDNYDVFSNEQTRSNNDDCGDDNSDVTRRGRIDSSSSYSRSDGDWPRTGQLEYKQVDLYYNDDHKPINVIKNSSFNDNSTDHDGREKERASAISNWLKKFVKRVASFVSNNTNNNIRKNNFANKQPICNKIDKPILQWQQDQQHELTSNDSVFVVGHVDQDNNDCKSNVVIYDDKQKQQRQHQPADYHCKQQVATSITQSVEAAIIANTIKPVLKNITFKLNGGEKVGIIGRTGAGKSSIITTLFRLYEFEGNIEIDGLDINGLRLCKLRNSIGIIPQQSVLFTGTIRENLDPFGLYEDSQIWLALDKAHLREFVSTLPGKLDFLIIGIDSVQQQFSTGQKQLISLARVLLKQSKIVVLDEATANVDHRTDSLIQATIRQEFKNATLLTIAHRLETIRDADRIMILDSGRIMDLDTPERLLAKGNNYYYELVNSQQHE